MQNFQPRFLVCFVFDLINCISGFEGGEVQAVQCVQVDQWSRKDDQAAGTCPQTCTHHGGSGHAGNIDLDVKPLLFYLFSICCYVRG